MTRSLLFRSTPLASPAPWRGAVGAALVSRLAVLVVTALTLGLFYPRRNRTATAWYDGSGDSHTLLQQVLRASDRGDAARWMHAAHTLGAPELAWRAWFPLYPLAMRMLGWFGLPAWIAGTAISLVAVCVAAVLVRTLCAERLALRHTDDLRTLRATWVWLVFPTMVMVGWVSPLAVCAALVACTWVAARRDRHLLGGVTAGFALLCHPVGIVALPLLAERTPRGLARPWRGVAGAATVVVAGALAARAAGARVHDLTRAVAPLRALGDIAHALHRAWHALLFEQVDLRSTPSAPYGDAVGAAFLTVATVLLALGLLVAAVVVWRKLGAPAGLSCATLLVGAIAVPVSSQVPLAALPHLSALALPAFVLLGAWASATDARFQTWVASSAMLFGTVATGVAMWNYFG